MNPLKSGAFNFFYNPHQMYNSVNILKRFFKCARNKNVTGTKLHIQAIEYVSGRGLTHKASYLLTFYYEQSYNVSSDKSCTACYQNHTATPVKVMILSEY